MGSCILSSSENGTPLNGLFIPGGRFFVLPRGKRILKRAEVIDEQPMLRQKCKENLFVTLGTF